MEDLKFITAANIISLRTKAGMTQAQLAELLNYSDKSVSKIKFPQCGCNTLRESRNIFKY